MIKSYKHLKWISEKDAGSVFALNKGLALVSGDIFGWLNSDESYFPDVLHTVDKYFNDNPSWDVIYGASQFVDVNDNIIGYRKSVPFNLQRLIMGFNLLAAPSSVFVRCSALKEIGFRVDETLLHTYDLDLWIRLGKSHHIQNVPDCFSNFGIHQDGGVASNPMAAIREVASVRRKHRNNLNFVYKVFGAAYSYIYRFVYLKLKWNKMIEKSKKE